MPHSYSPHSYSASNYDDEMCLKPPLLLWLAVLFLCRAIMLPIVIGIGHVAGVNADAMTQLRDFWSAEQLVPAVIAIPVLCALCWRSASAPDVLRSIWARGRVLLALSAAVDIALPIVSQLSQRQISDQFIVTLFASGVDVYFLAYILAARRVRDTFLDFPPPLPPTKSAG
jgi:hypothetical protein